MTKIEKRAKFDFIRYANCWEDADILIKALDIKKDDAVLSIASSGDNSLSLLVHNPKIVVAVDLNPVQIALLELRIAAFKMLEYEEVLSFLGVTKSKNRLNTYKNLKSLLSEKSIEFFEQNLNFIEEGIIFQGKFEKYFATFRTKIVPLIHSKKVVNQLLEQKTIEQQKAFYNKKWNNLRFQMLFKIFFSKFIMGRLGRDPEFFSYTQGSLANQLLEHVKYALTEIETYSNPYLVFILTGNFSLDALPFYLRKENFQKIKSNVDKIKPFLGDISQAFEKWQFNFDAFNLSDIFEYMDNNLTNSIFKMIEEHSNKGARIAYWNMMADRFIPKNSSFEYKKDLSNKFYKQDKAFFYKRFILGIKK